MVGGAKRAVDAPLCVSNLLPGHRFELNQVAMNLDCGTDCGTRRFFTGFYGGDFSDQVEIGGAGGIRTRYLLLAKQALHHAPTGESYFRSVLTSSVSQSGCATTASHPDRQILLLCGID